MKENCKKENTPIVKNSGYSIFGGQRLRLNKRSYVRNNGGKKSLVIKATRGEIKTATNIGLLLMKTFNILDIMSLLSFNNPKESEN